MQDPIEHRIAQIDIAGRHIDLGPQHPRAVREFALPHAAKQIQIVRDGPVAIRAVAAGLGQAAAHRPHLFRRQIVDISLAHTDQVLGPVVELLEIVGCEIEVRAPVEPEPAHIALDRVDILLLLLGRVGVVKAQMTAAAIFLRHLKIQADRFGMPDMEIAVRLRRKAGHHLASTTGSQIGIDNVANEVASRFRGRFVHHYIS